MKKQGLLLTLAVLLLQLATTAQTPVVIPGSQTQKITSKLVPGQEYELQIMLPGSYGKEKKTYPVLYLMDSQWDFPLVTALYGQQYFDGFVPEMIVVGVTWAGPNANADSLRARDYTPTADKRAQQSGGAGKFLSFLKNELFPYVESKYAVDKSSRTLMGCSLGGLFTLYALFTEPGLFQNYVAASPAVAWDNEALYQYEKSYAAKAPSAPARLYLCVGGVESNVPQFDKFVRQLTGRGFKHLQVKKQVLENIGHSGTKGEGYERGLQYAFERPVIQLTAAQQGQLAGTYKATVGVELTLSMQNGRPVLFHAPSDRVELLAASENELYSTATFLKIHVKRDAAGQVTGFEAEQYGGKLNFSKVN